jgi:glutaminase
VEKLLNEILDKCRPFTRYGKVASYIPELKKAAPKKSEYAL